MKIKELFKESADFVDLQALIMFLVFEKKVLSMEDDSEKLKLYYLEKHNKRMNKELNAYKEKMKMKYKPYVYEIKSGNITHYIYANDMRHAMLLATREGIKVDKIDPFNIDELMHIDGKDITFRTFVKNKKPQILGGF